MHILQRIRSYILLKNIFTFKNHRRRGRKKMIVCPVHLPTMYLKAIEKLVEKGFYPCRSEVIRVAIRDMLKRDLQISKNLED